MTPRTYCEEAIVELCSLRARWASDSEIAQRLVVLSYFRKWQWSAEEFERELARFTTDVSPAVAAAARAISLDWAARATHRAGRPPHPEPSRHPQPASSR